MKKFTSMKKITFLAAVLTLSTLAMAQPYIGEANYTPENPEVGDSVKVEATAEGNYLNVMEFRLDGQSWDTVDCDAFFSCTNEWSFEADSSGLKEVDVRASNDEYEYSDIHTLEIEVGGSSSLSLDSVSASKYEIGPKESTTLKATVENSGSTSKYANVQWYAEGEAIGSANINVPADDSRTLERTIDYSDLKESLETGKDYELSADEASGSELSSGKNLRLTEDEPGSGLEVFSVSASPYEVRSEDSTTLEASIRNDLDKSAFVNIEWFAGSRSIGSAWERVEAGSSESLEREVLSDKLKSKGLEAGKCYSLSAEAQFEGLEAENKSSSQICLEGEDTEPEPDIELDSVYATNYSVTESINTYLKAEAKNPGSQDVSGTVQWFLDGEPAGISVKTVKADSEKTFSSFRTIGLLEKKGFEDGCYELSASINNGDKVSASEELCIGERDVDASVKSVDADPTSISKNEDSSLTAEVENMGDEEVSGKLHWYVGGKKVGSSSTTEIGSSDTEDFSRTANYSGLRVLGLSKNKEHDVKAEFRYDGGEASKKAYRGITLVDPDRETYDLDVKVVDQDGEKVRDAEVEVGEESELTDYRGEASFRLGKGSYTVEASKSGYYSGDRSIYLNRDREVEVTIHEAEDSYVDPEFSYSPSSPVVGETVEFDASGSSGDIVDYRWDFDDGESSSGREVEHSFDSSGWYSVKLTVEAEDGTTDERIRTLRVRERDAEQASIDVGVEDEDDDPVKNAGVSAMALNPYSFAVRSTEKASSSTRASSGDSGDYRLGFELDGRDLETYASYATRFERVSWSNMALESSDGDELVFRYDLSADTRESGYDRYRASQDLRLSSGEKEVTMILTVNGRELGKFTSVLDVPDDHEFEMRNEGGRTRYSGKDTRIASPDLPIYTGFTDRDGEASFDVPAGRYSVIANKPGYSPDSQNLELDEGEEEFVGLKLERRGDEDDDDDDGEDDDDDDNGEDDDDDEVGERIEITSIDLPASVCEGSSFDARVKMENTGSEDQSFVLSASGLGTETSRSYYLEEDEEITRNLSFSNAKGSGHQRLSFSTVYDSEERTVQVRSCDEEVGDLSATVSPTQLRIGSSVRVNGIVESGREEVDIYVGGKRSRSISPEPDGRFSAYVVPKKVGQHQVRIESSENSVTRQIEVLPTVEVHSVSVPNNVFEGEDFEVCADVESQTAPLVLLKKNGEVVESKYGRDEVCFERNERPGDVDYKVQALNRGASSTASRTLEVMEQDSEARSFPGQVASVESGSGMVKVELYNNRKELRTYSIELEGLPGGWTSQSRKEVKLNSGERKTEYIYLTPKQDGSFEATVNVETEGEQIHSENVEISSGGTDRQESLLTRLMLWLR
ncbi:MAG: PKD domain-containing protein [Candidatus Nanohaloarchaea archaeon]